MKKIITILTAIILIGMTNQNHAQTYDMVGLSDSGYEYDTLYNSGDTLYFNFTGLASSGYGNATIEVSYIGAFGSTSRYYTPILPGMVSLTDIGGNVPSCVLNTDVRTFAASSISTWGANAVIKLVASNNMHPYCDDFNMVKVRLKYGYCNFGMPVSFADFTFNTEVCPTSGPQTLTGIPAGGTFSGTNITGSSFNPAGLAAGKYPITYTYTDGIGCITTKTQDIRILRTPGDVSELVCLNSEPIFTPGGSSHVFSPMPNLSQAFDTAAFYTFPAVTHSPTTYFYGRYKPGTYYMIDTITNDGADVVDIDNTAGDDRGGIAITDSTVYMVGDNATVRFDLDLLTPGVALPIRDGLFTDLNERKIYSLYNTTDGTMPDNDNSSNFTCNALVALDADLNPTTEIISLSETLQLGSDNSNCGMFAGSGKLVIYNGNNSHAYAIDIHFGDVEDLGIFTLELSGSENWADWGVAGYDGTDYTVYYMSSDEYEIVAHNLTTDIVTPITQFSDVSDLASFVTHPVNQRLYFHYEGDAQFGGDEEVLGYIEMTDSSSVLIGGDMVGCPSSITYTFNSVNLGNDTTVCADNGQLFMLEAGLGYESYTWNGDNNNWNVYPAQNSGQYILEVVDSIGCTLVDTINVSVISVDCSLGFDDLETTKLTAYPVPNKGTFKLAFSRNLSNATITLVNSQGVTCFATELSGAQSGAAINATGLATGVYFVQLTSDEGILNPITVIIE
ncbi:hypothetical protein D3C71_746830 [compost metagenome]